MSTFKVDTLQSTTGGDVTLTNQSAAKAWVSFDNASTATIEESLNISNIVDFGTGETQVNLTNNMTNANYCIPASAGRTTSGGSPGAQWIYGPASFRWQHETMANGGSYMDADNNYSAALGDLA
jgi:hypothetical protein